MPEKTLRQEKLEELREWKDTVKVMEEDVSYAASPKGRQTLREFRSTVKELEKDIPPPEPGEIGARPTRPEGLPREEKEEEREATRRGRERAKEVARAKRVVGTGVRRTVGIAETIGMQVIGGLGKVASIRGIRHPDTLIDPKAKNLYLPTNPKFSPIGRKIENPMELYFGRGMRMPPEAQGVLGALQEGYRPDQIEVVTGLTPQQVSRGIQYLRRHKLIGPEEEV